MGDHLRAGIPYYLGMKPANYIHQRTGVVGHRPAQESGRNSCRISRRRQYTIMYERMYHTRHQRYCHCCSCPLLATSAYVTVRCPSVRLSRRSIASMLQQRAGCLLPPAPQHHVASRSMRLNEDLLGTGTTQLYFTTKCDSKIE